MNDKIIPQELRRPRGIAGRAFVLLALIGAGGAALDWGARDINRFWLLADPGLSAAVGLGVAILAVALQQLARLLLSRPEISPKSQTERSQKEPSVDRA